MRLRSRWGSGFAADEILITLHLKRAVNTAVDPLPRERGVRWEKFHRTINRSMVLCESRLIVSSEGEVS